MTQGNGAAAIEPQPCLCGRPGCRLPGPLDSTYVMRAIERWLDDNWLSIDTLRRSGGDPGHPSEGSSQTPELVEARRRVAEYLRRHGWNDSRIGRYLKRDHTTVRNLLKNGGDS